MIGIGIDTGGTYTDAVLYDLDKQTVLAKGKSLTTKENLETGIANVLDVLPAELLRQASVLSLSTTLATNACVEHKGGRAKLVLLGTTREVLEWIDAKTRYGLPYDDVYCIDTKNSFDGTVIDHPDWDAVIREQHDWFADAEALSVAEVSAMRNGGVCEERAREKLTAAFPVPFVMAKELALDLNVMERGATALLNARLLPIVEDFLAAVHRALQKRGLSVDELIVRSDGSLMSESIALSYPVQTILSGPAASVIGARTLAEGRDTLIVDMGGTTTDISIVENGMPVMTDRISIGGFKTQIKGVYIDTFGLGGDSRIVIQDGQLALDTRRVQPLCIACAAYPALLEELRSLVKRGRLSARPLHEILYLVREPKNPAMYNKEEQALIEKLREHPVLIGSEDVSFYSVKTDRLETEGIVMRCGLTPTDIMHIRGDFTRYDRTASELGAAFLMHNMPKYAGKDVEVFCADVYDMVSRKMYENIVRLLLQHKYPTVFAKGFDPQIDELIRRSWNRPAEKPFFDLDFSSTATLIGIGAPTHIFLPRVAEALHTDYIIPPHAEVANAVGAVTANITAQQDIPIEANYAGGEDEAFIVFADEGRRTFAERDEAIAYARERAEKMASADALSRGAMGDLTVDVQVHSKSSADRNGAEVDLGTTVTARVSGKMYRA